jgi:putative PIN family toxin of toxin-antitoxin system
MKIVVDTNVFIGACIGGGASSKVIEACIRGAARPLMSDALLLEYEDVLSRSGLFPKARLNGGERWALFEILMSKAQWQNIYFRWRPNLRDAGDNHIVELAIAAGARAIVTNNVRDFSGGIIKFDHIQVMRPNEFIREISG